MQNGQHIHDKKKGARKRTRRKYSKKVRVIIITAVSLLSVIAILLISGGIYLWSIFGKINYTNNASDTYIDSLPPESGEDMTDAISDYSVIDEGANSVADIPVRENTKSVKNYLLLGIDSRAASGSNAFVGRSDTTMILTINSKDKTIKLTSILRDTLVTIPGRDRNGDGKDDYAKFNAAYAYGGFDLLSKTIEQNFRLKIDKYIAVNFNAFSKCVGAMGGIDMALTAAEAKVVGCGTESKTYHLDGTQTLNYSRIRYLDSDFGRTDRQRKVISTLFKQAKSMNIGQLNNVLSTVAPEIRTNMSMTEFMGFVAGSPTYFSYQMEKTYYLPQQNAYKGETLSGLGAVLILKDKAASVTGLHQFIYN